MPTQVGGSAEANAIALCTVAPSKPPLKVAFVEAAVVGEDAPAPEREALRRVEGALAALVERRRSD